MNGEFPQLRRLFEAYFHDDWDLDHPNWEAVVSEYLEHQHQRPEGILAATRELNNLIALPDKEVEELVFNKWQTAYYPLADGMSTREWLTALREMFLSRGTLSPNQGDS